MDVPPAMAVRTFPVTNREYGEALLDLLLEEPTRIVDTYQPEVSSAFQTSITEHSLDLATFHWRDKFASNEQIGIDSDGALEVGGIKLVSEGVCHG